MTRQLERDAPAGSGEELMMLLDERLRTESECSLSDVDVLNELNCTPEHRLQMLTLAERLGVTRGGLTRIIDRLVGSGWVSRDRPEHNRREVYAVLTEDGARVVCQACDLRPRAHPDPRRPPRRPGPRRAGHEHGQDARGAYRCRRS